VAALLGQQPARVPCIATSPTIPTFGMHRHHPSNRPTEMLQGGHYVSFNKIRRVRRLRATSARPACDLQGSGAVLLAVLPDFPLAVSDHRLWVRPAADMARPHVDREIDLRRFLQGQVISGRPPLDFKGYKL